MGMESNEKLSEDANIGLGNICANLNTSLGSPYFEKTSAFACV
jgi:hypothetical protein